MNKGIDGIYSPSPCIRHLILDRGPEGPVTFVASPFPDPLLQDLLFPFGKGYPLLRGRHDLVLIMREDPPDQFTLTGLAGNNNPDPVPVRVGTLPLIESQLGLPLGRVRSMAGQALTGQDWKNLPVIAHLGLDGRQTAQEQEQEGF